MRFEPKRSRRAAGAILSAALATVGIARAAASPATWINAANGAWNVGANWSTNPFPNNGSPNAGDIYDVTIGATGPAYIVALNSNINVNSFTLSSPNATLFQNGGTFRPINGFMLVDGTYQLNGGTLANTTIQPTNNGTFVLPTGGSGTLSGDVLGADLTVNAGYTLNVSNGLTISSNSVNLNSSSSGATILFGGAQNLSGNGTFNFEGTDSGVIRSNNTLNTGSGIWIRTDTAGGALGDAASTIVSNGTISAMTSGKTLSVNAGTFTSNGTLEALNGGTLTIAGKWTNLTTGVLSGGYIHVGANSTITLGSGSILTNNASVFLDGAGSSFTAINGFTTNGGSFTVGNGRTFTLANNFANNGTLEAMSGGQLNLNTGTNNGTMIIDDGGTVNLTGSATYSGSSRIFGGGVLLCSSVQNFNGSLTGNITMGLAGSASFGPTAVYSPAALLITSSTNSAAAGAKINPGFGGLRFSGSASPAFVLSSGTTTPATMTLGGDVSVSGNGAGGLAQILTSGSLAIDGTLDLGNAQRTFTIAQGPTAPDLLVSTIVTDGAIYKSGPGTMSMTHSNSYLGGSMLADGTMQVSSTDVLGNVNALGGGSVIFQGGTLSVLSDSSNVTVPNTLVSQSGATINVNINRLTHGTAGTFTVGTTTLGAALSVTGAGTLVMNNATLTTGLSVNSPIAVTINAPLSGPYGLFFGDGQTAGTYMLGGSAGNTNTGSTTLYSGLLALNKSSGNAIAADLQILGGQVQLLASNQIADSSHVEISNGTLDLVGTSETVGSISLNANGAIVGAGTFTSAGIGTETQDSSPRFIIAQNGSLTVGGPIAFISGTTITAGDWRAQHGTLTLSSIGSIKTNQGSITLDGAGSTFTNLASPINQGTLILLEGASFPITSKLQNPGSILMDSQSTLLLKTTLNLAGMVSGGTVTSSGGSMSILQNGTLSGVKLNSDVSVGDTLGNSGQLYINSGLTLENNHVMTLYSSSGLLADDMTQSNIGGVGSILMAGSGGSTPRILLSSASGGSLTFGGGVTVHGRGQIQQNFNGNTLINQGTISSDVGAQTLEINFDTLANSGTLQAINSGVLSIDANNWSSTGTISTTTNSIVNLGGSFAQATMGKLVHNSGTVNLTGTINNGLKLDATTGTWYFNGGTISGGTVSTSAGASLVVQSNRSGALNGVKLDNDLSVGDTLGNSANLYVNSGLTLENNHVLTLYSNSQLLPNDMTQSVISGAGSILMAGSGNSTPRILLSSASGGSLTFGGGVTVHGRGQIEQNFNGNMLITQGTISADVSGQELEINFDTLANSGTLQTTNGGILSIDANNWSSTGTISVLGNSTINLGGSFAQASMGTLVHNAGTINLTGTINNGLKLDATTGSWYFNGGTISGGTVSISGGASLVVQIDRSGALSGVKLDSDLSVGDSLGNSADLYVNNGLTLENNHVVTLYSSSQLLPDDMTQSIIGGVGSILMAGSGGSTPRILLSSASGGSLTFGAGVTVHGRGQIEQNFNDNTLINQGTISSDLSAQTLSINFTTFTNSGMVQAINGGSVSIDANNLSNTGTISLGNSGSLHVMQLNNAGTIDMSGSAIIDYSASDGSPFVAIRNQIVSGFNHGQWNGPGINSSAASAGGHLTGVGYAEASALSMNSDGSLVFMNRSVDGTTMLLLYTYCGDANLDGTVDSSDFDRLAANFGASGKFWTDGDYNYDGIVNALDFNALASNYGQVIGTSADVPDAQPAGFAGLGTVVPEPVAVLPILAGFLIRRRRRLRVTK